MTKNVEIYTDGACRGNPGVGGWGVVLYYNDNKKCLYGSTEYTTNNKMELTAVIEGLRALKCSCQINLYTDSQYVKKGMTEWISAWKNRGWKTANKKPVKNIELWQALDKETQRHKILWHWVEGHAGNANNELADSLANKAIDERKDS